MIAAVVALIISLVGSVNDALPSCAPVEGIVQQVNAAVAANGNGHGDGVLFVYEDCSIGYQD